MPWSRLELAKDEFAEDGDTVTDIEGDGSDIEDARDGSVGAEADEIDGDGAEDGDPDCVERGLRPRVDLHPDVGHGDEAIARKGEDGARQGLLVKMISQWLGF